MQRRSDFEIKAIKYLRSYHPKTKYPLAWRRFYDAAFIRVYADKWVTSIANSLARACIISAWALASGQGGSTCFFLELKKVSPKDRWDL